MWSPKRMGSFQEWTQKNGGHSVWKNAILYQNFQFYFGIAVIFIFFQNVRIACENL